MAIFLFYKIQIFLTYEKVIILINWECFGHYVEFFIIRYRLRWFFDRKHIIMRINFHEFWINILSLRILICHFNIFIYFTLILLNFIRKINLNFILVLNFSLVQLYLFINIMLMIELLIIFMICLLYILFKILIERYLRHIFWPDRF